MAIKTYSELQDFIAEFFADNTEGAITEEVLRDFSTNLIDSLGFASVMMLEADVDAKIEAFKTAVAILTNKKIEKRVVTAAGAAINIVKDITDSVFMGEVAANTTINNPTGAAPKNFEELEFFIKDLGASKTLTWDTAYGSMTDTLPANTPAGKWLYLKFSYNITAGKYFLINKQIQP